MVLLVFSLYRVVQPKPAEETEIMHFHSTDYVSFLHNANKLDDEEKLNDEEVEQYGLSEYRICIISYLM